MTALVMYIIVLLVFLTRSLLILDDEIFSLNSTRDREARAMSRKRIKREISYFLLSPLWPVRVLIALKTAIANREKLRTRKNG